MKLLDNVIGGEDWIADLIIGLRVWALFGINCIDHEFVLRLWVSQVRWFRAWDISKMDHCYQPPCPIYV
jgi:hypothetical protein